MNSINRLTVKYRNLKVGTLTMSQQRLATFQYDKEWLKSGFSISPIELPLSDKLFVAKREPFNGNFGIFEDSLPDGYGRYLLHKMLQKQSIDFFSLTPIQLLSIIGNGGMGALSYEPESFLGEDKNYVSLDSLQRMALEVLNEKQCDDADVLYYNSGNSGGCRPKCLYNDKDGHWLLKFRNTHDPSWMAAMEYKYNEAARKCNIQVPDFKLIEGKYFASRRFDIDEAGERLHTATASALLCEPISPPMTDYKNLLGLTGYITQDPNDVEEMFRRMVFNVLSKNKDDHAKNFTYIYRDGKWHLGPAYDLTYTPQGYNNEHATSVNYKGNPTIDDMVAAGTAIRINRQRCLSIIEEMKPICETLLDEISRL